MPTSYEVRVRSVPWGDYRGSCGASPLRIPGLLIQLVDSNQVIAHAAVDELWNVLCHQHNPDSSALPALPFLLEALDEAPDELAAQILDIVFGFSAVAIWHRRNPLEPEPDWVTKIRAALAYERPRFLRLANSSNEDIAAYAQGILEYSS